MGVIENAKELADLIRKAGDVDLYRRIVELEGEVIELTRQLRSAQQEAEESEKKLKLKGKLSFREPFYYVRVLPGRAKSFLIQIPHKLRLSVARARLS